jgi:hypothetical protein
MISVLSVDYQYLLMKKIRARGKGMARSGPVV